jgi:DNA helicase-2/ATP-dependent DNA helicase PcrA
MRLAYVAITRAKQGLICTTSHFRNGDKPVAPSALFEIFSKTIRKMKGGVVLNDTPVPVGRNPFKENPMTGNWPKPSTQVEKIRKVADLTNQATQLDIKTALAGASSEEIKSILLDMQSIINEIKRRKDYLTVTLPNRLSVSTLLYLAKEPQELAIRIRRPMPNHIDKYARRGTEFHLWLENHFKHPSLISMDELFNQGVTKFEKEKDAPLDKLQKAWLASDWASKNPIDIEVGFETMINQTLIRGRIDAVYQRGVDLYEVVDWKTGKVKDGSDLENAAIQLAMYRLAYAKLKSVPIANVSAAFHYVSENQTVRPSDILDESDLIELISKVPIEI